MVNLDVIYSKINSIQNCLQRIHDVTQDNENSLENINVQDIVVLNLQRAVQLCIDMASHVIASQNLGLPSSLKDTFIILQHNTIISTTLADKMCRMIGFRNIACHDYQKLDNNILKSIINNCLHDFEDFYTEILMWHKK